LDADLLHKLIVPNAFALCVFWLMKMTPADSALDNGETFYLFIAIIFATQSIGGATELVILL